MFAPVEFRVLMLSVLVANDPTLSAPVAVISPMFDRLRLSKLRGVEAEVVDSVLVMTVPVPTLTAAAKTFSIFDRVLLLNEIGLKESVDVMLSTLSVPLVKILPRTSTPPTSVGKSVPTPILHIVVNAPPSAKRMRGTVSLMFIS
jgi:hypothetical protein